MHIEIQSLSREISRHFDDFFKSYGLATCYVELILLLSEKPSGTSQSYICKELNLAPSTVTRFIQKLEKKKFIKKERDGKAVSVRLSAQGETLSRELEKVYEEAESQLNQILGEQFVETTEKMLKLGIEMMKERS